MAQNGGGGIVTPARPPLQRKGGAGDAQRSAQLAGEIDGARTLRRCLRPSILRRRLQ